MSATPLADDFPEAGLIDRIANGMPDDVRAAYYRELMHCRSLPQSDEMLRILRIMQILTFLIQRAPEIVVSEREQIEQICTRLIEVLQTTTTSIETYQSQLDERLAQLPDEIAERLRPHSIAAAINESLQQQFRKSTIPATERALEIIANRMERVLVVFSERLQRLEAANRNAADTMVSTSNKAIEAVLREGQRLSRQYRWPFYAIAAFILVLTFLSGARVQHWWDSRTDQVKQTIVTPAQPVEPIKVNAAGKAGRR